jgi:RNA polymerase sigma-70 factor (ECF subfamily)
VETAVQPAPAAEEDALLVDRVRRGDAKAFDEIVARHKRTVYLTARRLLATHEDADEAAQIAFVRAWKSLAGFRGDASLRTWLVRIVLNVAKSMRTARRPHAALEDVAEPVDPGEGSDEHLRRRQAGVRVRRAVAGLPSRQREVVVLKLFSDMTHREVAASLGLSEGAVKAHLHQAVANLRRTMALAASGRT